MTSRSARANAPEEAVMPVGAGSSGIRPPVSRDAPDEAEADWLPAFRHPNGLPGFLRGEARGEADEEALLLSFRQPFGLPGLRRGEAGGETVWLEWLPSFLHPTGLPRCLGGDVADMGDTGDRGERDGQSTEMGML